MKYEKMNIKNEKRNNKMNDVIAVADRSAVTNLIWSLKVSGNVMLSYQRPKYLVAGTQNRLLIL
jgi:hypothetical protein